MTEYRTEHDFLGDVEIPADAYYGVQTMRAVENFPISGLRTHREFIAAVAAIKEAAAIANGGLGALDRVCNDLAGRYFDDEHGQGMGQGKSFVIARRCIA